MQTPSAIRVFRDLTRLHVRAQRADIACRSVSETHCTILTELGRSDAVPMSALVSKLQLDKGWVSRAVDQLVREGLVQRVAHEADRRAVTVSLTATGRKEFKELEVILDRQLERVFDGLKPADRAKVAHALTVLHDAYMKAVASIPQNAENCA